MTFRSFLDTPCGIRYMFDTLDLQSACGRKALLDSRMMRNIQQIEAGYERLQEVYNRLIAEGRRGSAAGYTPAGERIVRKLQGVRDVSGTMDRLGAGAVLDDIELFEVKYLSLISQEVRQELEQAELLGIALPDLDEVIKVLDPEGLKISSFYVYDAYSQPLREVRNRIKGLNVLLESGGRHPVSGDETGAAKAELQELLGRMNELEGEVRADLSRQLKGEAPALKKALKELAELDLLQAKALQINVLGLCFPQISPHCHTSYRGMFHPQIKAALIERGGVFTPIDLVFGLEPVTLIGANMGGKTVVLKMTALNQLLFQFGFGIAAESARIDIKNRVMLCVGDEQNELKGLSSFAAEMKAIDAVLQQVKRGERILALIDEPARTTNPVEGTVLVEALIKVLCRKEASVLLTTHYNIGGEGYRRLRVKGLSGGEMDYRLEVVSGGEIPHEAIEIAEQLGIDREWIGEAARILKENN